MKNFKKISQLLTLIVAMAAFMFSCVNDEYDIPPITQKPIGAIYTIQQVKDSIASVSTYTFEHDASVYATVTMDNESDNSYKTFFIQDNTAAIAVFQNPSGGVYIGDSVRVYLKDLIVMKYNELFQINNVAGTGIDVEANIIKQGYNNKRVPQDTTLAAILANPAYWQGRLVKLSNVQFVSSDTSKTYANAITLETENRYIQDSIGNLLIVRTSGYSTFADAQVPNGSGSIIAIVSQYGADMQLVIRKASEVVMTGTRFDIGGGGSIDPTGTGTFADPYNVASGISNQGQTAKWVEGYMVGVYETVDEFGVDLDVFAPSFTAPFNTVFNVIIADSQDETNIQNCLIIKLTSGEIRNTLNLVDNVSNKGKQVKVYGDLMAYFSKPGQQNVTGYWFEGAGINPDVPADLVVLGTSTTVASLNEIFTSATVDVNFTTNGWLNANKVGERYWQGKEFETNKYVQATAFLATSTNIESWLVTPGVTLTTPKKLNFDSKAGYYKHAGLTVWVSTNFDGNNANLLTSTWTQINPTIATSPSSAYGEWVNSGDVNLSAYSGTIYVLFKYVGDKTTNTTTFQLDNVQIVDL